MAHCPRSRPAPFRALSRGIFLLIFINLLPADVQAPKARLKPTELIVKRYERLVLRGDLLTGLRSSLALTDTSEEGLHRYRKRIKAARYLLEIKDASPGAKRFANQLKQILDPIGRWHDLLLLAEEATALLGKRAILAQTIRAERDEALLLAINAAGSMSSPKCHHQLARTP